MMLHLIGSLSIIVFCKVETLHNGVSIMVLVAKELFKGTFLSTVLISILCDLEDAWYESSFSRQFLLEVFVLSVNKSIF